jgi:hypothetical protein
MGLGRNFTQRVKAIGTWELSSSSDEMPAFSIPNKLQIS